MKLKNILLAATILVLLSLSFAYASDSIDGLNTTSDFNQALDSAQKENKEIVIIFDQNGCYYCDELKNNVLMNPNVQDKLNANYITFINDVNENPEIAAEYKVFGTPTVVLLDPQGKQIQSFEGYGPAEEFFINETL